jgi:hypothetical protein
MLAPEPPPPFPPTGRYTTRTTIGADPTVTDGGGILLSNESTPEGVVCPAGVPPETFVKAKV